MTAHNDTANGEPGPDDLVLRLASRLHAIYCADVSCEIGAVMAVDVRAARRLLGEVAREAFDLTDAATDAGVPQPCLRWFANRLNEEASR